MGFFRFKKAAKAAVAANRAASVIVEGNSGTVGEGEGEGSSVIVEFKAMTAPGPAEYPDPM